MSRRVFDRDCKLAAVRLIVEDEMDVKEVSGLLDIHYNTLYRWVSEYEKYGQSAFHGNGVKIYDHQAEIRRQEKKNRELLKQFRVFRREKNGKIPVPQGQQGKEQHQEGLQDAWNLEERVLRISREEALEEGQGERGAIRKDTQHIREERWMLWQHQDLLNRWDFVIRNRTRSADLYVELSDSSSIPQFSQSLRAMNIMMSNIQLEHENICMNRSTAFVCTVRGTEHRGHDEMRRMIRLLPGIVYVEEL